MLELYQDDLADLLLPASQKQQGPQKVSLAAVFAWHTEDANQLECMNLHFQLVFSRSTTAHKAAWTRPVTQYISTQHHTCITRSQSTQ